MSNQNPEGNEFAALMGFEGVRHTEVNPGEEAVKQSVRHTELNDENEKDAKVPVRHTEMNDEMQTNAPFPEYAPGETLNGYNGNSYEIIQKIDKEGGEAVLYRARKKEDKKEYAIKIYRREKAIKEKVANKLKEVNCPYLPKLYEVGKIGKYPYEVMQFYAEGSLEGQKLSLKEIREHLLPSLNEAFHVLHNEGIIHQDIKPSNIMRNGESYVVMDFGISGIREDGRSYVSQVGGFSTDYLPPNELNAKYVSPKWDYYSLGITLFELFAGRLPYAGMNPQERMQISIKSDSELGPVLPVLAAEDNFKKLLNGLTKKNPGSRWGYEQVKNWLEGKQVEETAEAQVVDATNDLNTPYSFEKKEYTNIDRLMEAMAQQWETGMSYLFQGNLHRHMEKNDRDDLAILCKKAANLQEDHDKVYANWLYSMANHMEKLYWKENSWTLLEFGKLIIEQLWKCEDNYSAASKRNFNLIMEFLQTDVLTMYCNSQSDLSPEHEAVAKRVEQHMKALRNLSFGEAYCRELYALAYTLSGKMVLRILGKEYAGYADFMKYLESLYQDTDKEEELVKLLTKLGIAGGTLADDKNLELQFSCWLKAVREQTAG